MINNKKNGILYGVIILLIISLIFLLKRNNTLNVNNQISEQNRSALLDTIRVGKNKIGQLTFSKGVLISKTKDLNKLNAKLNEEVKKEKGKVYQLTRLVGTIKNTKPEEPIVITNTIVESPKGVKGLEWSYEKKYDTENYRNITGVSRFKIDTLGLIKPLNTIISKDEIKFNVIQGFREKDDKLEMFVRSDYPGFTINELSSVILDPNKHPIVSKFVKKKRFGLSFYLGYGITANNGRLFIGPQFGGGVTYSLIRL